MRANIVATEAFRYTAEIRQLDRPDCGYSFKITGRWVGAKNPDAERTTLQITLDAAGLRVLRDLIDSAVQP